MSLEVFELSVHFSDVESITRTAMTLTNIFLHEEVCALACDPEKARRNDKQVIAPRGYVWPAVRGLVADRF